MPANWQFCIFCAAARKQQRDTMQENEKYSEICFKNGSISGAVVFAPVGEAEKNASATTGRLTVKNTHPNKPLVVRIVDV